MTALFKKLNFKNHSTVSILNSPKEFEPAILEMQQYTKIVSDLKQNAHFEFVLTFVKSEGEVIAFTEQILPKITADGILWFAYPKGSSKKHHCEINRDHGWYILGKNQYEPVRNVAIDEDWSAIRFRKVDFIKNMTRSKEFTLSTQGKQKTTGK